ncbi:MAG: hypothetical protein JW885_13715 [Deltaproteobacteria bacterium]|nr:hypothetical protein [Candidatus Zymogenaceae bacterium]
MNVLLVFAAGLAVSLVVGISIILLLKSGINASTERLTDNPAAGTFWKRTIGTVIILAAVSGALSVAYPEEAASDRLIMLFAFMDQMETIGLRLLITLLVVFSVMTVGVSMGKHRD